MKQNELDWSDVKSEAIPEVMRLAETHLAEMLQIAIAADQRAVGQSAAFATLGSALLAAVMVTTKSEAISIASWCVVFAGLGLIGGAFISGMAARPIDYFAGGYEPRGIIPCANDVDWMRQSAVKDMQRRIDHNRKVIGRTADVTAKAFKFVVTTTTMCVAAFLAAQFWPVS